MSGGKEELLEQAYKTAETIASYSRVAVVAGKEVVNKSQELSLKEGVEYERRLFHALFGSKDQKIGELALRSAGLGSCLLTAFLGMTAFAEKKKAEWSHE